MAMRRIALIATVSILALSACSGGGSDGDSDDAVALSDSVDSDVSIPPQPDSDPGAPETPIPISEPASVATQVPVATEPIPAEQIGDIVDVSLVEWAVESSDKLAPGVITFNVTNDGDFPHHFAIARGDSYETLPQVGGGAIDEATLAADFLGRTSNIQSGGTATIEFDLEPGNYVFFCTIAGTVSHAAQGQVLSVTVADVDL